MKADKDGKYICPKCKGEIYEDRDHLCMIHRDRTASEKARIKKAEKGLKEFLSLYQEGELDIGNLPIDVQNSLRRLTVRMGDEFSGEAEK